MFLFLDFRNGRSKQRFLPVGMFDFDGAILRKAVDKTLKHRGREQNLAAFEEIRGFNDDVFLNTQWRAFESAKAAGLLSKPSKTRCSLASLPSPSELLSFAVDSICIAVS